MWSHSLARGCGIQLHAIIDGRTGGTVAPQTKIWEEEPPPPPPHTHTHTHAFWCRKTPTDEFDIDEFYLCHRQL